MTPPQRELAGSVSGTPTPLRSLLIGLGALTFPLALLLLQWSQVDELDREVWGDGMVSRARARLATEQRSAESPIQVRRLVARLLSGVKSAAGRGPVRPALAWGARFQQRQMPPHLVPPHDLFLIEVRRGQAFLRYRHQGAGFWHSLPALRPFALWAAGRPGTPADDRVCSRALGYPLSLTPAQHQMMKGEWRDFHQDRRWGKMLWEAFPTQDPETQVVVVLLIEARVNDSRTGPRLLTRFWSDPSCGIAFLSPTRGRSSIFSASFRQQRNLAHTLQAAIRRGPLPPWQFTEGHLVCAGMMIPESPYQVLLAFPLPGPHHAGALARPSAPQPEETGSQKRRFLLALVAIFWCTALFFFVERLFFGRGPPISVGRILSAAFVLAAILPLIGSVGPSRRLVADTQRAEANALVSGLSRELDRIQRGADFFHAGRIQLMRQLSQDPRQLPRLRQLEGKFTRAGTDLAARALAVREADRFLDELISSLTALIGPRHMPNHVYLLGPDGLLGNWERIKKPKGIGNLGSGESIFALLGRDMLGDASPRISFQPISAAKEGGDSRMLAIVREAAYGILLQNAGQHGFNRTMKYPLGLVRFVVSGNNLNYFSVPVRAGGMIRYALTWIWSDEFFDRPYLTSYLQTWQNLRTAPDQQIFGFDSWGAASGEPVESVPPGLEKHPELMEMVEEVRQSDASLRRTLAERDLVLEARPPDKIGRYIVAGSDSTAPLRETAAQRWRQFLIVQSLIVALALFVALGAARHFLEPLQMLLSGMERLTAGDFSVQLDLQRQDEFGSLGTAFDGMARKLREGQMLGRFVSSTVRRTLEDPEFRAIAQRGVNSGVTILFSQLVGFEGWESTVGPEEIFAVLGRHLEAADQAVRRHGGEIDKVMGEKILILFPHEGPEGDRNALTAALAVAWEVKGNLYGAIPLETAMGLNSGQAVLGIVGAHEVRHEYTAIGDTVNLAARLATIAMITPGSRLMISGAALALADGTVRTKRLPIKRVKGKTREVEVHEVQAPEPGDHRPV